ncbi:peptidylprolyl isomerase [Candidatus Woesearchaeota archaeon]|nr:peptidylprolyl isomerase [Candidatus Woesearchaeota archaeon]
MSNEITINKKTLKKIGYISIALLIILLIYFLGGEDKVVENRTAVFNTTMGTFKIELFEDTMPLTTKNFIGLVEKGTYNGVIFHRVIEGFMIQGGDPTGTGRGDPSIPTIKDEFTDNNKNNKGTISMANRGPDTGSSQFFINLVDNNNLDPKHPVFGKVIEGMDIVEKIGKVKTDAKDKPIEDIVINKITLE